MDRSAVKALTFDVFGMVVDYRSTIIQEGAVWNQRKGLQVDWGRFADAWHGRYRPFMNKVMRQELPWLNLDALHRLALEETLTEFHVSVFTDEEKAHLNSVWHRLQPWPDSIAGLTRLRQRYILATLSNGNVALLVNMAKQSGLPWDCILSAELVKVYKPDPRTYQMAISLPGLRPEEVMMVAAHQDDLYHAQAQGMRVAFVPRPLEHDPDFQPDLTPDPIFDVVAQDFLELAEVLGA